MAAYIKVSIVDEVLALQETDEKKGLYVRALQAFGSYLMDIEAEYQHLVSCTMCHIVLLMCFLGNTSR